LSRNERNPNQTLNSEEYNGYAARSENRRQVKKSSLICSRLRKARDSEKMRLLRAAAKGIKTRRGRTEKKYESTVERRVYYNPFHDGKEVFVHRDDIPELDPIWGQEKGQARSKMYEFINSQNLRLVREIEPMTCAELSKIISCNKTSLVSEISALNPE